MALEFTWIDYSLFGITLGLSVLIGAYFGFFVKKQDSPKEYLHGGKKMQVLPIAASLVASDISGITLLGVPADIYQNGSSYSLCVFSAVFASLIVTYIFMPVYYKLQVSSSFEYLKLRFSTQICIIASLIFAINSLIYLPIVVYLPALAFSQVTGFNLNILIPIICLICIFYTTIGGIKAVVWTDTLQMIIMISSLMIVFILGVIVEGGFETIWKKAEQGSRIDFNLHFDPTDRNAFFTIIFGFSLLWCGYGNNPIFVQRFLAVPTLKQAKLTNLVFCCGTIFFKAITSFLGLIVFAHYAKCDPLAQGSIKKVDQILPYYIMDVSSAFKGLPGLFVAGVFCAALSTMSSGLNTMTGTIYEDFLKPYMPSHTTDKRASDIMKFIVVVLGFAAMGLVFVVPYLGAILQLNYAVGGISAGPIMAMFTLGMLCPFINEKGIIYGSVSGFVAVGWLMFGHQYYVYTGQVRPKTLSRSIEECMTNNITTTAFFRKQIVQYTNPSKPLFPYRISFHYYTFIGLLVTTLIAVPISLYTGGRKQNIHPDLLSPIVKYFMPKNKNIELTDIEKKEKEKLNINS